MWHLLRLNLTHIIRTRLLFFVFIFSFFIQFIGIQVLHSASINLQGVLTRIGYKEAIFLALFFELFTGAFLAAVYGIWMMPYAHQGPRSALTFTLPVSKWAFALSYGIGILILLIVQHVVMLCSYGMIFGFATFLLPKFPWAGFLSCLILQTLAFEVFAFAFAVSSMTFGQISTLFLGNLVFFILQLGGALFKLDLSRFVTQPSPGFELARHIYEVLPPLGEIVFDLRHGFAEPALLLNHSILWALWLAVFAGIFRWKLRYPARYRGAEA